MKYKGLKKVAGDSKNIRGGSHCVEVAVNRESNKVISHVHASDNSWIEWKNGFESVGYIRYPISMVQAEEWLDFELGERDRNALRWN